MNATLEKIDKMRKERGWSVNKLAMEAELTQSTIAHMFSRGTLPSLHTLRSICEAYGITMAQFFSDDEDTDYLSTDEKSVIAKKSVRTIIDAFAGKEN